jgi:ABC-type multidrug transport system ATPase subunit
MDPVSRKRVFELFKEIKKNLEFSMVFTTHQINEVEKFCDKISIMKDGRIRIIGD